MKKLKIFSFILVAILSVSLLSGCLFSDSASIKDCYNKYEAIAEKYSNESKSALTIKANKEEYAVSQIVIKFDNDEGLGNYINNSSDYSLLNNDLQQLLNGSLLYFYNYQAHLKMEQVAKKIPQKNISAIYVALENMEKELSDLNKSKKELQTYWDTTHSGDSQTSLIGRMFENCVNDYFNVINSALEVSAKTRSAVSKLLGDEELAKSTKSAVLSVGLDSTKILANYYQQYIQYNGIKSINQTSSKLRNYYNRVVVSVNAQILSIGSNFNNVSEEKTTAVVGYVNDLQIVANEMYNINQKLDKNRYTLEEDSSKYYMQSIYDSILDKSIVNNALNNAINCF